MSSSPTGINDPICLNFHESLLRKSDVRLLKGPYWLNDQVISFYFEYLEKVLYQGETKFLFISPEVTQCIKIIDGTEIEIFLTPLNASSKEFIFFPLNDNEFDRAGGTHWSLLLFSRRENLFFHYDSANGLNSTTAQSFAMSIRNALKAPAANYENIRCLQQSNGYDCGIHVLCQVDELTNHITKTKVAVQVPYLKHSTVAAKRGALLQIIQELGGRI